MGTVSRWTERGEPREWTFEYREGRGVLVEVVGDGPVWEGHCQLDGVRWAVKAYRVESRRAGRFVGLGFRRVG